MSVTEPIDTPIQPEPRHVDEFIWNPMPEQNPGENYAAWILMHFRLPASHKFKFERFMKDHKLFCTYGGNVYRVTGASRLGDVWLANDLDRDTGYDHRVNVDSCRNWRATP